MALGFKGLEDVIGPDAAEADEWIHIRGNVAYWSVEGDDVSESAEAQISECLEASSTT